MTRNEMISELKKEFPTLNRQENDEIIPLTVKEYEETIGRWADNRLKQLENIAAENQSVIDREALLNRLGISADEAALLLS